MQSFNFMPIKVLATAIFFKIPTSESGIQDRFGGLFFLVVHYAFTYVMDGLGYFHQEKRIIKRERAAGTYRASTAFIATQICIFPVTVTSTLLLAIPVYWTMGLQNSLSKFLIFQLISVSASVCASIIGYLVGAIAPTLATAQILGPLVVVVGILFAGQVANLKEIKSFLSWIQWISSSSYTNKALTQNEFFGQQFTCPEGSKTCLPKTGEVVISNLGLDNLDIWYCILGNVALSVVALGLGYFFYKRNSAPLMRLDMGRDESAKSK
jgi:ABC-type multidrug transport system permease subunit